MSLLHHGGGLIEAAKKYNIAESSWLDLSTGVSPWHYPISDIPSQSWNRLPEEEDGLIEAADRYYAGHNALPVAGSQAAIQCLPVVLAAKRGGPGLLLLPKVGYKEHERAWRLQGWQLECYDADQYPTPEQIGRCDVLLVINPNNPSASVTPSHVLHTWLDKLSVRGAFLIVDEAFMDMTPEQSMNSVSNQHLVVLRSVGKFFGLAGIRAGFVFAPSCIRLDLQACLGPWCLNGPARIICAQAFADIEWQQMQIRRLRQSSERLRELLSLLPGTVVGTSLFQTIYLASAPVWHDRLCQYGILTRLTDEQNALRFGIPADDDEWQLLINTLNTLNTLKLNTLGADLVP